MCGYFANIQHCYCDEYKKEQVEKAYGIVVEAMPNTTFMVKFENNKEKLAYLSGKMRKKSY